MSLNLFAVLASFLLLLLLFAFVFGDEINSLSPNWRIILLVMTTIIGIGAVIAAIWDTTVRKD